MILSVAVRKVINIEKGEIMSYLKDSILGYLSKNKKWVIFLAVCLIVIFLSSFIASGIQTDGWTVEVTDLRDAENEGTIQVATTDSETGETVM